MSTFLARLTVVAAAVLLTGISSLGVQSELYPVDHSDLIEVCADGIVFVPPGTKYVRCNGKVRKVLRIDQGVVREGARCKCPDCCEGQCFIIVACTPVPQDMLDRISRDCATGELHFEDPMDQGALCTLYLGC